MICERCKAKVEDNNVYKVSWKWSNKEKDGAFCQQVSSFSLDAVFCASCIERVDDTILNGVTVD